ncbi:MAG: chloride channel protein [Phycisphaerae bacterium]|nr:MAG: CBS domain-containing protein [Planctomycetota bacterium]MBE7458477.1 chloride channel protein [Planctomycetia bacterium]MCK6464891.1 chloride channel protein [Phycisphaerae bacterium]MCL4719220.1 chloride channel protein [Phycisphaerae bacterium]MCQ3921453.1 hypothetical protein [Planctomycetota bacterium]
MKRTPTVWHRLLADRIPRPAAKWSRMFLLATLVGVVCGSVSAVLEWALHHGVGAVVGRYAHLGSATAWEFKWGVLLLPALGGLISGLVVHWFCRDSRGHGTDELIRAFHRNLGNLPLRGPATKAVANVAVLSCGGSTGPEGPVAALSAAIGSAFGRVFPTTAHERRVLLVAGCAAGVGSIFRCPLGGALFATSVLYREPEYESDAMVPSVVASVMGYSAFISWMPMLGVAAPQYLLPGVQQLGFDSAQWLLIYALLGPLCAVACILLNLSLRVVERGVEAARRVPSWFAPALGGLATGAIACMLPQVMDGRYAFIRNALSGELFASGAGDSAARQMLFIALVLVFKGIATGCTVGSGASGGVLGPSVFLGGVAGMLLGTACECVMPGACPEGVRQGLIPVGMGGVLAATMRTPLAAVVMVTEMTGSYGLIVPLMLVCVSAYMLGRRWGLNREQVATVAASPAHAADAMVHVLESWPVSRLTERNWQAVATPSAGLEELAAKLTPGTRPVFAVLDGARLAGVISMPDLSRMLDEPGLGSMLIAADIMTERVVSVYEDDDLYHALAVFQRENHDVLPVVTRDRSRRFVGMLTRRRVFEALREHILDMQKHVFREHEGLAAMEREGQIDQLITAVAPQRTDHVQRLLVPLDAIGKSLREADFRRAFGAHVVAIEQPDGSLQCPPDIDAPLNSGQRLLAIVDRAGTG